MAGCPQGRPAENFGLWADFSFLNSKPPWLQALNSGPAHCKSIPSICKARRACASISLSGTGCVDASCIVLPALLQKLVGEFLIFFGRRKGHTHKGHREKVLNVMNFRILRGVFRVFSGSFQGVVREFSGCFSLCPFRVCSLASFVRNFVPRKKYFVPTSFCRRAILSRCIRASTPPPGKTEMATAIWPL